MLAEQRRRRDLCGRRRELHRVAGGDVAAADGMLDLDDHLARVEVRIAQNLAGVEAGAARHAGAGQDLHDLVLRAFHGPRLDHGVDLVAVAPARIAGLVTRVADEVLAAHGAEEGMPHLLLREDEHVIVGSAGMAAVRLAGYRGAELIARALGRLAQALMITQAHAAQVHDRVLHRHLDLLTLAGRVALHERGQDPDHAVHARPRIADGRPDVGRRALGEAGHAHRPAHRLGDGLVALVVAVRAVGAEALDARVHQARVELLERGIAEAETIDHARTEVLEQHVGRREQPAKHVLAARVLEIDREAAFVAVEREVEQAVGVGAILVRGPGRVALARFLDLDHVRSQPCEHLTARRAGLIVRDVDDANAGQGAHRSGLAPSARPSPA